MGCGAELSAQESLFVAGTTLCDRYVLCFKGPSDKAEVKAELIVAMTRTIQNLYFENKRKIPSLMNGEFV